MWFHHTSVQPELPKQDSQAFGDHGVFRFRPHGDAMVSPQTSIDILVKYWQEYHDREA